MSSNFLPIPASTGQQQQQGVNPQVNIQRLIELLMAQRATPPMMQAGVYPGYRGYAHGGDVQDGEDPHLNNVLEEVMQAMSGSHPDPEGSAMDYAHFLLPGSMDDYERSPDEGSQPMGGDMQDLGMGDQGQEGQPHEGLVDGEDGGMDDTVPAETDDGQPVALSNGEFVIPADVVAMLGDGNTQAGANKLESFISQFRQMKYGEGGEQPEKTPDNVFDLLLPGEGGDESGAPGGATANTAQGEGPSGPPAEAPSEEAAAPQEEEAPSPEGEEEPQPAGMADGGPVADPDPYGIHSADQRMLDAAREEQYWRQPSWMNPAIGGLLGFNEGAANLAHQDMQEAARRGLGARKVRGLAGQLTNALGPGVRISVRPE